MTLEIPDNFFPCYTAFKAFFVNTANTTFTQHKHSGDQGGPNKTPETCLISDFLSDSPVIFNDFN